jgi:hypothetical protein
MCSAKWKEPADGESAYQIKHKIERLFDCFF